MQKTKSFEIISERFEISKETAKYFLIQVQKSFKTEKPPHQLIVEFMAENHFEILPHPHQVATMLNESGLWVHPLKPAPPIPMDEEDIYGE